MLLHERFYGDQKNEINTLSILYFEQSGTKVESAANHRGRGAEGQPRLLGGRSSHYILDHPHAFGEARSLIRTALFHWVKVVCMHDATCKHKYYSLKARGKTYGQALRYVGDRLLNVLCTMLENNTLYEPKLLEVDTAA